MECAEAGARGGVGCLVIDIVGASAERVASSSSASSSAVLTKEGKARRGGRFYNIYKTYLYGDKPPRRPFLHH
jgi:hypothetical protein